MKKLILLVFIFLLGCSSSPTQETIKPIPIFCEAPPKATPFHALPVRSTVLLLDGKVWIATDTKGYENLSRNLQAILSHIRQKNAIVDYYKNCIDNYNKLIVDEQK